MRLPEGNGEVLAEYNYRLAQTLLDAVRSAPPLPLEASTESMNASASAIHYRSDRDK